MCGIAGFYKPNLDQGENILNSQLRSLYHRGPDEEGKFIENDWYLGMRRLSIQDLKGGKQPFFNEDNSIVVLYNGEIYNYPQLRSQLQKKHILKTHCDTEIIPHCYEEAGEDFPQFFNGMFAVSLLDRKKDVLYLARDRWGIKPLYYYYDRKKKNFAFASEIKALREIPYLSWEISPVGLFFYLYWGFIPAPFTIYKNLYKLLPSYILKFNPGDFSLQFKKYYQIRSLKKEISDKKIREILLDGVNLRLLSDVPVGVFLSGGLDSSVIVALLSEIMESSRINTFSVAFKGEGIYDESYWSDRVAQRFKTSHTRIDLQLDYDRLLETFFTYWDEPFADSSALPTLAISEAASRHIKVVLSGTGGDEVFLGYRRYLAYLNFSKKFSYGVKLAGKFLFSPFMQNFIASLDSKSRSFSYLSYLYRLTTLMCPTQEAFYLENMGQVLREQVKEFLGVYLTPAFNFNHKFSFYPSSFDFSYYLEGDLLVKEDRATMAHSIEGRVPFLDHRLVEAVTSIPAEKRMAGGNLKFLLKKIFKKDLPDEVIKRKKQGFAVPMDKVLASRVIKEVVDKIKRGDKSLKLWEYIDVESWLSYSTKEIREFSPYTFQLWKMVVLEKWLQTHGL